MEIIVIFLPTLHHVFSDLIQNVTMCKRAHTRSASLSTNVNLSVTDCGKLCNFADGPPTLTDCLSPVDGRCSMIGWVADILCQIIDRNFTHCHWQFLQMGQFLIWTSFIIVTLISNINTPFPPVFITFSIFFSEVRFPYYWNTLHFLLPSPGFSELNFFNGPILNKSSWNFT